MNLKELRKTKRLTQWEAAELIGVSLSGLRKWEQGQRCVDYDAAAKIAKAYEVKIELVWMAILETQKTRRW